MVSEANRILGREQIHATKRGKRRAVLLFLAGMVLGAALFALTCIIMP
jgi:hypothetical protein